MPVDAVDRIDIRKLVVERPKVQEDPRFILEKEIDPDFVKEQIASLLVDANAMKKRARSLAFIGRLLKLNAKFRPTIYKRLTKDVDDFLKQDAWQHVPTAFSTLKLNDPQMNVDVEINYVQHFLDWQKFKDKQVLHLENLQLLVDLRISLPHKFRDFEFSKADRDKMLEQLSGIPSASGKIQYAANMKMICNWNDASVGVLDSKNLIAVYNEEKNKPFNNPFMDMLLAVDLAILDAERVEFDNNGNINLILRKKAATPESIPTLPEVKKYGN